MSVDERARTEHEGSPGAASDLDGGLGPALVRPLAALGLCTAALTAGVFFATQPAAPTASDAAIAPVEFQARPRSAAQLYQELCSLCHGAGGAGDGPTQLERPARSFVAGAYAYGDSLGTVMRTLEFGIPGSAMPAFGEALSLQERTAMARYVLGLREAPRVVAPNAGDLAATVRPAVIQGLFRAPHGEGAVLNARLVGFPDGTAVLLSSDPLTVIGVYQSDPGSPFVRRADWRGRGDSPTRPLGDLVWAAASDADLLAAPSAETQPYTTKDGQPLRMIPRSTRIYADRVAFQFDLESAEGKSVAQGLATLRSPERDEPAVVLALEITAGADGVMLDAAASPNPPRPSGPKLERSLVYSSL